MKALQVYTKSDESSLLSGTSKLRLGFMGLGYWGGVLAEAALSSGCTVIVSCYSPSAKSRELFARRFSCRACTRPGEIFDDPEVEAVVIATPNRCHAEQIAMAAEARKHVFVEKPIALELEGAVHVTRLCKQNQVVLAVGHQSRRHSGVRAMKELIRGGELGRPVWVEANISSDTGRFQDAHRWRAQPGECPGGPLIQLGIHHIDTLRYLLGRIVRVCSLRARVPLENGLDSGWAVLLDFENGVLGALMSHYGSARACEVRVSGTEAVAVFDPLRGLEIRADTRKAAQSRRIELTPGDPIAEQFIDFARSVRLGAPAEVGGEEATAALAVVLAAMQSFRERRPVAVRSPVE
ncbi:MAG: Gfo/Idh/MocA family oxidoreductase [Acidobacteria bacterium]|nr:Gfo/Idh/MocA family oxidoreductase [Acidobacteriota bacterium]